MQTGRAFATARVRLAVLLCFLRLAALYRKPIRPAMCLFVLFHFGVEHIEHAAQVGFAFFVAHDGFAAFAAEDFEVGLGHFVDKAAGLGELPAALAAAFDAVGEGEAVFGAGNTDVHEAAFFVEVAFFYAVGVGEEAFFAAGEDNVGLFEAFGGVQGGEGDGVGFFFAAAVEQVHQGDGLGEFDQGFAVLFAFSGQPGA